MGSINTEYASKGLAGTALGFGIGGAALGLLNNNCGGGGILGNLLGGNCCRGAMGAELQYVSDLQSKVARLEAEKYADHVAKETYSQALADNRALRDELYAFIKPLAEEAANNRVNIATLAAEQKCCCEKQELREQIVLGKVNEVALTLGGQINTLSSGFTNQINCINNTLASITKTVVPNSSVCPGWGNVTITPATTTSTTTPAS